MLKAYSLARSHLGRHAALSAIFEVAREWRENDFIALMTWIEGAPLGEFTGVFPLLAEEQQETSGEALALRWLRTMCEAWTYFIAMASFTGTSAPQYDCFGSDLVLTDYDFVGKIGEPVAAPAPFCIARPPIRISERPLLRTTSTLWRPAFSTWSSRKSRSNTGAFKPKNAD